MALPQVVKDNPFMSLASAGSMIALVAALFTVDERYAHAVEVEKDKVQTQQLIKDTSRELRKSSLEDKIFELDVKKAQARDGRLPPVDEALHERYKRQLKDLKDNK
jgi:hypothetical protein